MVGSTVDWKCQDKVEDLWLDLLSGGEEDSRLAREMFLRTMDRYEGATFIRLAKVWKMGEHVGWGSLMSRDLVLRVDEEAAKYTDCLSELLTYLSFDIGAHDYAVDRMVGWLKEGADPEHWNALLQVLVESKTKPPQEGFESWRHLYKPDAVPDDTLDILQRAASLWGWNTRDLVGEEKHVHHNEDQDGSSFRFLEDAEAWAKEHPGDPRIMDVLANFAHDREIVRVLDQMIPSEKISFWGAAATKSEGETLNYALYSLVEYFASDDEMLRSRSVSAIVGAAWTLDMSPRELIGQYWEVIGLFAVRHKVCDLLAVCLSCTEAEVCRAVEKFVVPIGVLEDRELIDYMVETSGSSIEEIIRRNMADIIAAVVRVKSKSRCEGVLKEILTWAGIDTDVHDIYGGQGVRPKVLLSVLGHWNEKDSGPVDAALATLASWGNSTPRALVSGAILSLMLRVADTLDSPRTLGEKTRALTAMQKVATTVDKGVSAIFPQLFVCLQSAINSPDLRSACVALLVSVGERLNEDLLIASVFHGWWNLLSDSDKDVINSSGIVLHEPTLANPDKQLSALVSWQRSDNVYVARRLLLAMQELLFASVEVITVDKRPAASQLVHMARHFSSQPNDVAYLACVNLGVLNAPRDIHSESKPHPVVVDWTGQERRIFCLYMLTEVLSRAYAQSTEVRSQQYLAVGIQQLLISENLTDEEWNSMDKETRSLLIPLSTSTFYVGKESGGRKELPSCNLDFKTWIVSFCRSLTSIIKEQGALAEKDVFELLIPCVKRSVSTAKFLCPYLFTSVVVHCNSNTRDSLRNCIVEILSRNISQEFYRTVFGIVDYLIVYKQHLLSPMAGEDDRKGRAVKQRASRVESFLHRIDSEQLVARALECESYSRTVLYLDTIVRRIPSKEEEVYQTLFAVYSEMQDTDALSGIATKMDTLTPQQQVVQYEGLEKWDLALSCWSVEHFNLPRGQQYFKCLLNAHKYDIVLHEAQKNLGWLEDESLDISLEAAWRMGNVDHLREWCSVARDKGHVSYSSCLAKAMLAFSEEDTDIVSSQIRMARNFVKKDLVHRHSLALSLDRLHALADFEAVAQTTELQSQDHRRISTQLDARLSAATNKLYILDVRKFIFSVSKLSFAEVEVAHVWTNLATQYRKAGRIELATAAALQGMVYTSKGRMEYAELLWQQGDTQAALKALDQDRARDGEVALLYAQWLAQSGHVGFSVAAKTYVDATELAQSEKAYYELARFYHGVIQAQDGNNTVREYENGKLTLTMITALVSALQIGDQYATETLPLLLTAWLDMGEENSPTKSANLNKVNTLIKNKHAGIRAATFYHGLTQMTARIGIKHEATLASLFGVIIHVCKSYPSRTIWYLLGLASSTKSGRKGRGVLLLNNIKNNPEIPRKMVGKCEKFASSMRKTTDMKFSTKLSKIDIFKDLQFPRDHIPSPLCVPCLQFMGHPTTEEVSIAGIRESVSVMRSLQHPLRIVLIGSDGKDYPTLLKPRDDVRKDARLLEFTRLVDNLLSRTSLGIRTYFVIPLGESCGVIEWVSGSVTIKSILLQFYPNFIWKNVTELFEKSKDRTATFVDLIKTEFSPSLYKWFVEKFSEPHRWLRARDKYTKSLAVMSIVGYILGLGDRHLENLLLLDDGGVMHVDFDCLFEKALSLGCPEVVPFRLTHNLVDAMGITGYEGHFRRSCETTLALLREHEYTVMTALESFVHDPLNEWKTDPNKKIVEIGPRKQASTPKEALAIVRKKIQGVVPQEALPLSVAGEVEDLIQDATSPTNLSRMYIGWLSMI